MFLFHSISLTKTMAPTICEDDMEPYGYQSSNRVRRQCSVINYGKRNLVIFTNRFDSFK